MKTAITLALLLATAANAGTATPPPGALQFCVRNPSFCSAAPIAAAKISDLPAIMRVNRQVNGAILPDPLASDAAKRAENGNWRVVMPGGVGGCVEFATTKMLRLAWDGIPMGAMHLAQVRIPQTGELHMVLLVRINNVQVVLDNLTNVAWGPEETQYQWLAVQDGWRWATPDWMSK